jgi:hypothetical protein
MDLLLRHRFRTSARTTSDLPRSEARARGGAGARVSAATPLAPPPLANAARRDDVVVDAAAEEVTRADSIVPCERERDRRSD